MYSITMHKEIKYEYFNGQEVCTHHAVFSFTMRQLADENGILIPLEDLSNIFKDTKHKLEAVLTAITETIILGHYVSDAELKKCISYPKYYDDYLVTIWQVVPLGERLNRITISQFNETTKPFEFINGFMELRYLLAGREEQGND